MRQSCLITSFQYFFGSTTSSPKIISNTSISHNFTLGHFSITFHITKPFQNCFSHFVLHQTQSHRVLNILTSNLISTGMDIYPVQHTYLCNFHLLNVNVLDWSTFCQYNIVGPTNTLSNSPLNFGCKFLSHKTTNTSLHFIPPTPINR